MTSYRKDPITGIYKGRWNFTGTALDFRHIPQNVRYKKDHHSLRLHINQAIQYFQHSASCERLSAGISSSRWIEDGYEI
jgi:hypothetical protein